MKKSPLVKTTGQLVLASLRPKLKAQNSSLWVGLIALTTLVFAQCTQNAPLEQVNAQKSVFKTSGNKTFSKFDSNQYNPILLKMKEGTHKDKLVLLYATDEENLTGCSYTGRKHNIMVAVSTEEYTDEKAYGLGVLPLFNEAKPLKKNTGTPVSPIYQCLNSTNRLQFTAINDGDSGVNVYFVDSSVLKLFSIIDLTTGVKNGENPFTSGGLESTTPIGAHIQDGAIYLLTYDKTQTSATGSGSASEEINLYYFKANQSVSDKNDVKVGESLSLVETPIGAALVSSVDVEDTQGSGNKIRTAKWLIGDEAIRITATIASKNTSSITGDMQGTSKDLSDTLGLKAGLQITNSSGLYDIRSNHAPDSSFMVFSAGIPLPPSGPGQPPSIMANTENIYAVTTHTLQDMWDLRKQLPITGSPSGK